jgi:hypothetical protein
MGEPSRRSPACGAQAAGAVVPRPQRLTSRAAPRRLASRDYTVPPGGRRAASGPPFSRRSLPGSRRPCRGPRPCRAVTRAIAGQRWGGRCWRAGGLWSRPVRQDASPVLLADAVQRAGVAVVVWHRERGRRPEDVRRLQGQGRRAEAERAQRSERHQRGKRHAARAGGGDGAARRALGGPLHTSARGRRPGLCWHRLRGSAGGAPGVGVGRTHLDAPGTLRGPYRPPMSRRRTGVRALGLASESLRGWPWSRSRGRRISVLPGSPAGARGLCCTAWCRANPGARPSTGTGVAPSPPRAGPVPRRLTAAWGPTPSALAAKASVSIPRDAPICGPWRCDRKAVRCGRTPRGWPRRPSDAGNRPTRRGARSILPWRYSGASWSQVWHGCARVLPRGASKRRRLRPGSPASAHVWGPCRRSVTTALRTPRGSPSGRC